jgi:hypothetical protein
VVLFCGHRRSDNDPEELQEYTRRQPFQQFRVILTTGTAYEVRHPDLIMVGRRSAVIGITNDSTGTAYDRAIHVYLLQVVAVEALPGTPSSANGSAT